MSFEHNKYTFTLEDTDTNPYIPYLIEQGQIRFHKDIFKNFKLGSSPEEEESIHDGYELSETNELARNRSKCHKDLKAIIDLIMNNSHLIDKELGKDTGEQRIIFPTNKSLKVVDIGPGASGDMVKLLEEYRKEGDLLIQMDINSKIVKKLKAEAPKNSRVKIGSILRRGDIGKNIDAITSLSSLDVTQYLDLAIENIANALKPGGYLFSLQDVRPGLGVQKEGLKDLSLSMKDVIPGLLPSSSNLNIVACYRLPDGSIKTSMELFKIRLGAALVESGAFDIHVHHFIHATTHSEQSTGQAYYANMHITGLPERVNHAYAIATLAQKKEPKMIFIMPGSSAQEE